MALVRLRTRPERLRQEQAEVLRQALLPFTGGELRHHVDALVAHIDRETCPAAEWTFVMINAEQNAAVVNWLATHSARPLVALRIWALAFAHLDRQTGEILLSRDQIAEAVDETADHVSGIMTELVQFGAISRQRVRVAGMRGPGRVRYFMNPMVGTHLAGRARVVAQASAPQLRLV
jgi:hypothetical protein